MFQFYLSSIKSLGGIASSVFGNMFQFYLSSIKSLKNRMMRMRIDQFQFYLSSIKSNNIINRIIKTNLVSILP